MKYRAIIAVSLEVDTMATAAVLLDEQLQQLRRRQPRIEGYSLLHLGEDVPGAGMQIGSPEPRRFTPPEPEHRVRHLGREG